MKMYLTSIQKFKNYFEFAVTRQLLLIVQYNLHNYLLPPA